MLKILIDPLISYRMVRWLYLRGVPIIPRLITYWIRFFWGAFIPHTAGIGSGTRVGYGGLGVVIHERAIIGSGCMISQHVTIGGNDSEVGVPVIGEKVQIGAGAKVLGTIRVVDDAVVGANAVVISDVWPHEVVGGVPARVLKNREMS